MKIALISFTLLLMSVSALDINNEWKQFKLKHGKSYNIAEDFKRKTIFARNLKKIEAHNKLYEEGKTTFKLGVNSFTDMPEEEFKVRLGFKAQKYDDDVALINFEAPLGVDLPGEIDWRDHGAVTEVKDQSSCGSCWAFSATGALEGQYFLKSGKLESLSEKNLVDCSKESINIGCQGGDMVGAFQYVHNNDGIDDEESYPYKPVDGRCNYNEGNNVTSAAAEVIMAKLGDEEALKALVALYGPVAIAIDAGQPTFQAYEQGVYYEADCISAEEDPLGLLDHGVLLVGYGSEDGVDYWLVKNSWGPSWGEAGYIKMARNKQNNCGIASYASIPVMY